ncbi:hypothetical protein Tco_0239537, partial [Tanacetum coccineum]
MKKKEETGIQLNYEEFDFMVAAAAYDEIEEVNANCTLTDNLQQAALPVYDLDGSAENYTKFNRMTVMLSLPFLMWNKVGGIVEQHLATTEETHDLYDSLYNNLATKVETVNSVNRNLKETNAELTTKLVLGNTSQK